MPSLRPESVCRPRSLSLSLLCAVQGCERFAYLAMLPLFVLFIQEQQELPASTALLVLALFQALSYLGGLPAGWLADRKLGAWGATLLGLVLLGGAYGGLALAPRMLLCPTLAMMVVGHNLFKPGIHVLIANVCGEDERAREQGFLWHYLSINLGHAAGALFGAWAHGRHGWSGLFAGAAAAVAVGMSLLAAGAPSLRRATDVKHTDAAKNAPLSLTKSMHAVWLLCGVALVFWLTAQQAGGALSLFAATNTAHELRVWVIPSPSAPATSHRSTG